MTGIFSVMAFSSAVLGHCVFICFQEWAHLGLERYLDDREKEDLRDRERLTGRERETEKEMEILCVFVRASRYLTIGFFEKNPLAGGIMFSINEPRPSCFAAAATEGCWYTAAGGGS